MQQSMAVQQSMAEVGHLVDSFPWVLEEEVALMDTQKQDKPQVPFEEGPVAAVLVQQHSVL